jgi:hypothetical protein
MVKLLPESDFLASSPVERQIDDGPLGAHDAQGESRRICLTPTLEHDIGAAIAGPMAPPAFQHDGWVGIVRSESLQAQVGRDVSARQRGVNKHYCRSTV